MSRLAAASLALMALAANANPLADVAGSTTTSYSQVDATYLVAGVEREFSHSRLSLDYSEMGNSWFYGGISIGLAFIDGESEPLVDDSSVPGYGFGIFGGIRKRWLDDRLGLHLEGGYRREWVSGSTTGGDDTSVRFGEGSLRAGLSWRFTDLQVSAGGYSSNVVGDIERTGTTPGTADFEDTESSGAYAELDLKMDGGFAFGLRGESGARETIALTFSSSF